MTDFHTSLINHFELLPVAVYICNRKNELRAYNIAAENIFGQLPQTGQQNWYPLLAFSDLAGHPFDWDRQPLSAALLQKTDDWRQEVRCHLPDGTYLHILVNSVALRDPAGDYNGAIYTLSDVTALRSAESGQALLAAIIESSEDAIIAKDLDGRITSWNRAAERMFGYIAAEAIGRPISLIIPRDRLDEEKRIIQAVSSGKKVEHFETVRISKNGAAIPISLTISPIRDSSGKVVGASKIARDITRQKEAEAQALAHTAHLEEMVAKRTAELDQALQKERELGQLKSRFVSMASHEFRTPLSAIKLSVSLIAKYAEPYGDTHIPKHIARIKNSVNDLSGILGDFLSLEKLESGKLNLSPAEFDLPEFCRETATEIQMLCKPGQRISYEHTGAQTIVLLDQQLLKNCLHNLLSNAIKYSGENTLISIGSVINDNLCSLTVQDQGIGIPEADQPHMFSAFFRAGNTGNIQGTGLGLNIVARYAGLMNGAVSFKSKAGIGTTFTVSCPARLEQ